MTGRSLRFLHVGWVAALAVVLLLWSGDVRAVARRSWGWHRSEPAAFAGQTSAQGTTGQTTSQGPTGQQNPPQGRGGRPGGPGGPGTGRGGQQGEWKWWKDETARKEVGLRDQQVAGLDRIYDRRAKSMEAFVTEYNTQKALLDKMVADRVADDATIALQISKMQAPRLKLEESRILMNYQMLRVLDPDQYRKLQAFFDKMHERGRGGAPRPR